jgi:hypothetical protein
MEEKITEIVNLVFDHPESSLHLRLFWVTKNEFIRIYYGRCSTSSYAKDFGFVKELTLSGISGETRGKIIALFAKLEFLVNELIQLKLLGFNSPKGKKLDDLLEEVNFDTRVKLLKEWDIINDELRGKIIKVHKVRSALAHVYNMEEIGYPQKTPGKKQAEEAPLRQTFDYFKNDLEEIWKSLIVIYQEQQKTFGGDLNVLIKRLQESSVRDGEIAHSRDNADDPERS